MTMIEAIDCRRAVAPGDSPESNAGDPGNKQHASTKLLVMRSRTHGANTSFDVLHINP
jgi:hypothetical protein